MGNISHTQIKNKKFDEPAVKLVVRQLAQAVKAAKFQNQYELAVRQLGSVVVVDFVARVAATEKEWNRLWAEAEATRADADDFGDAGHSFALDHGLDEKLVMDCFASRFDEKLNDQVSLLSSLLGPIDARRYRLKGAIEALTEFMGEIDFDNPHAGDFHDQVNNFRAQTLKYYVKEFGDYPHEKEIVDEPTPRATTLFHETAEELIAAYEATNAVLNRLTEAVKNFCTARSMRLDYQSLNISEKMRWVHDTIKARQ